MQANIPSDFNANETKWLHTLYQQAPVAIGIYIGPTHIIEFANSMMCEIWDRFPEQVLNKPLFEALPEVAEQGFEEILAEVLKTGEPFVGNELPAPLERNGTIGLYYFNILYKPLRNDAGRVTGIVQVATDVTELVEARKKAEYNEEIIKLALEGGKMGTWYHNFVQGTTQHSLEHDRIFGYNEPVEEWNPEIFLQHILPEDRDFVWQQYEQGKKSGKIDFEARLERPDGSIRWIHVKGKSSYNLKQHPVSMSGIVVDVTEHRQAIEQERQLVAEQAARQEAERQGKLLNELFMKAPALICILKGPALVFDMVNPLYQQLFTGRQLKGRPLLEALPEIAEQSVAGLLQQVYATGETASGTEVPVLLSKNGSEKLKERFFNFVYQALCDTEGKVTGVLVFAFEVTEQVNAREEIARSEESLRLAMDAGKMGTWDNDLIKNKAEYSLQHAHILGYPDQSHEWNFERFIEHVHPEDRDFVKACQQEAKVTGNYDFETRIRRVDGEERWVVVKGKCFFTEEGKPYRMAGITADISERKEAEQKLKELTAKLASSNRELMVANAEVRNHMQEISQANHQLKLINADLDNFIYAASHDLKAPINNIEGLVTLLRHKLSAEVQADEVVKKTLDMINASIERFKNTILELTDIARLQKGEEIAEELDVAEIVREVELDIDGLILETGARVSVQLGECKGFYFSHKNFKSIVYNLLSNALKYHAPERKPEIKLSCGQEGDFLVLRVKDNGLGMKSRAIHKIFSMFTRLHTHVEGTGVGLYLVKRIVDNAGGRLEVESKEGEGSLFEVYFPLETE